MAATGATWLRIGFLWSSIEQSPGIYYWNKLDQVVGWARERGLRILANVSYTPDLGPTGRLPGHDVPAGRHGPLRRGSWATSCAHYSPLGVKHYEVWNEPNQHFWWKPKPQPGPLRRDAPQGVRAGQRRPTPSVTDRGRRPGPRPGQRVRHHDEPPHLPDRHVPGRAWPASSTPCRSTPTPATEDPRIVAYYSPITRRRPRPRATSWPPTATSGRRSGAPSSPTRPARHAKSVSGGRAGPAPPPRHRRCGSSRATPARCSSSPTGTWAPTGRRRPTTSASSAATSHRSRASPPCASSRLIRHQVGAAPPIGGAAHARSGPRASRSRRRTRSASRRNGHARLACGLRSSSSS